MIKASQPVSSRMTRHTGQPEVECVQSIPTQSQCNHFPGLTTTQRDVEDIENSQGSCSTSNTNSTMDDLDNLETPISALIQSPAQQSTSATDVDPPSMTCLVVPIASGTSGMILDNNDPSKF
ncbi:hypothetical protein BDN67DRAFT_1015784 [Paxillus ammoniavirescens]|nr:hypothetical protein BDN67DRAFT_1015784 [Paxillus ammoniavirescens]